MSYFKCFLWVIFYFVCLFPTLEASTKKEVFAKYPNQFFIETGSFYGDGIQMALDTGFPYIYSIELSPHYYKHCLNRFSVNENVYLIHGDSAEMLSIVLSKIDSPATFWLDGHYSSGNTAKGKTNTPLMLELEEIARHAIKIHTILIDDVRLFGTEEFDFIELEDVINKIKEINPDYIFKFEDGYVLNDVLVAYLAT